MSITGVWLFAGSWGSGTVPAAAGSVGIHCHAPAGLFTFSHS